MKYIAVLICCFLLCGCSIQEIEKEDRTNTFIKQKIDEAFYMGVERGVWCIVDMKMTKEQCLNKN